MQGVIVGRAGDDVGVVELREDDVDRGNVRISVISREPGRDGSDNVPVAVDEADGLARVRAAVVGNLHVGYVIVVRVREPAGVGQGNRRVPCTVVAVQIVARGGQHGDNIRIADSGGSGGAGRVVFRLVDRTG